MKRWWNVFALLVFFCKSLLRFYKWVCVCASLSRFYRCCSCPGPAPEAAAAEAAGAAAHHECQAAACCHRSLLRAHASHSSS